MNTMRNQLGISLVEILVSLVISLFLLGGIVQVYFGNQTSYTFANALSQVQENGRFALDTISRDLRAAGDWGCINFDPDDTDNIGDNLPGMAGYDADLHDFRVNPPVQGTNDTGGLGTSDTITISGSKPGQTNVVSPFNDETIQFLYTNAVSTLTANDIVLIARCGANDLLIDEESDIFRITSVGLGLVPQHQRINHNATLSQQYENDATITELQSVTYTINNNTSGQPALFRSEFGNNQEVIEGILDMQILYGIDTGIDGYANQYLTADNVTDFQDVVSARVMLLVQSTATNVTDAPQSYTFNGAPPTTAADNRLYQVFSTTVALRNRIGKEE